MTINRAPVSTTGRALAACILVAAAVACSASPGENVGTTAEALTADNCTVNSRSTTCTNSNAVTAGAWCGAEGSSFTNVLTENCQGACSIQTCSGDDSIVGYTDLAIAFHPQFTCCNHAWVETGDTVTNPGQEDCAPVVIQCGGTDAGSGKDSGSGGYPLYTNQIIPANPSSTTVTFPNPCSGGGGGSDSGTAADSRSDSEGGSTK
jgi:hypothetical protein